MVFCMDKASASLNSEMGPRSDEGVFQLQLARGEAHLHVPEFSLKILKQRHLMIFFFLKLSFISLQELSAGRLGTAP